MDTIYVIYYNGKRLEHSFSGNKIKIAYLKKGSANGVITCEAEELAKDRYNSSPKNNWYELPRAQREALIAEARKEFEVKEYVPK